MFRVGLSITLVLSMMPGPWLCCCTAARLSTAAGLGQREARPQASPSPRKHGCCCCHDDTQPAGGKDARPASQGPLPVRHHCPCRERQSDQAVLPPAGAVSAQSHFPHDAPATPAAGAVTSLPARVARLHGEGAGRHLPFLSARDILRALHVLRC
jgi:hypothetical protein